MIKICSRLKGPATRNDFVNDARADAIFATLKAIIDDETSTISLQVAHSFQTLLQNKLIFNIILILAAMDNIFYNICLHISE